MLPSPPTSPGARTLATQCSCRAIFGAFPVKRFYSILGGLLPPLRAEAASSADMKRKNQSGSPHAEEHGWRSSRLDIIDGCLCLRRDNDASAKRRGVDPVVCSAAPASRHSASAVEGPGGGATSRRGFHALISDATLNQQMERLEIIQKDLLKRRRDGYVEVRATGLGAGDSGDHLLRVQPDSV